MRKNEKGKTHEHPYNALARDGSDPGPFSSVFPQFSRRFSARVRSSRANATPRGKHAYLAEASYGNERHLSVSRAKSDVFIVLFSTCMGFF